MKEIIEHIIVISKEELREKLGIKGKVGMVLTSGDSEGTIKIWIEGD